MLAEILSLAKSLGLSKGELLGLARAASLNGTLVAVELLTVHERIDVLLELKRLELKHLEASHATA